MYQAFCLPFLQMRFTKTKPVILRNFILFVCWIVASLSIQYVYNEDGRPFWPQFVCTLLGTSMTAVPLWLSFRYFVPQYLYKKRIALFLVSLTASALLFSILFFVLIGLLYYEVITTMGFPNFEESAYVWFIIFIFNEVVVIIGCSVKVLRDRYRLEDRVQVAEDEAIKSELLLLKAQLNPHFLFNILNTIYFQIRPTNALAKNSVEMFSDMLRYQLYECNAATVSIAKEIAYITNYVAMQSLRLEPETNVELHVEPNVFGFEIAPLLLLPLVENAFKHLSHHDDAARNKLHIAMSLDNQMFTLSVRNTFTENATVVPDEEPVRGGIGIVNVQRRIELLYPESAILDAKKDAEFYLATLKIDLQK